MRLARGGRPITRSGATNWAGSPSASATATARSTSSGSPPGHRRSIFPAEAERLTWARQWITVPTGDRPGRRRGRLLAASPRPCPAARPSIRGGSPGPRPPRPRSDTGSACCTIACPSPGARSTGRSSDGSAATRRPTSARRRRSTGSSSATATRAPRTPSCTTTARSPRTSISARSASPTGGPTSPSPRGAPSGTTGPGYDGLVYVRVRHRPGHRAHRLLPQAVGRRVTVRPCGTARRRSSRSPNATRPRASATISGGP